jgi:hypothetical protein
VGRLRLKPIPGLEGGWADVGEPVELPVRFSFPSGLSNWSLAIALVGETSFGLGIPLGDENGQSRRERLNRLPPDDVVGGGERRGCDAKRKSEACVEDEAVAVAEGSF